MPESAKTAERRRLLAEALLQSAERAISEGGVRDLKARALAEEAGCAVGAIYNVFPDLDAMVFAVNARTLDRLEDRLRQQFSEPGVWGDDREVAIEKFAELGDLYIDFARSQKHLWRALFEHRIRGGGTVPDWYRDQQARLFRYLDPPLAVIMRDAPEEERFATAMLMFSAVHGVVLLGLEEKLGQVPLDVLRHQVRRLLIMLCEGVSRMDDHG